VRASADKHIELPACLHAHDGGQIREEHSLKIVVLVLVFSVRCSGTSSSQSRTVSGAARACGRNSATTHTSYYGRPDVHRDLQTRSAESDDSPERYTQ
jgi:hypothetical protein